MKYSEDVRKTFEGVVNNNELQVMNACLKAALLTNCESHKASERLGTTAHVVSVSTLIINILIVKYSEDVKKTF